MNISELKSGQLVSLSIYDCCIGMAMIFKNDPLSRKLSFIWIGRPLACYPGQVITNSLWNVDYDDVCSVEKITGIFTEFLRFSNMQA